MPTNFYYVYVLRSHKDRLFYIGLTKELDRRISEHQAGKNTSTAKRLPFELIYFEAFKNKTDAERRERYLKTSKGKTTLRQMVRDYLDK